MNKLTILTHEEAGDVVLENFEEIKAYLEERLERYRGVVYLDNVLKSAKADRAALNKLKKILDDRRKEIKRKYMEPYMRLEAQIKELTAMIDEPLERIDSIVRNALEEERANRRAEIKEFYDAVSQPLGDLAESVFAAPWFYEKFWDSGNSTRRIWEEEVLRKVAETADDLIAIKSLGSNTSAMVAKYLEVHDMKAVAEYGHSLEQTEDAVKSEITEADDGDRVVGSKILKISGTHRQMDSLEEFLKISGLTYEVLDDETYDEMTEITEPNFNTFVAFDIETTGSLGEAKGDRPSEITEIGAVKVVNGVVVDRCDWLCNPGRKVTPVVVRLTHITDKMLADKPPVSEVIQQFSEFVGSMPLVGHNIKSSDLHYIVKAGRRAGVAFENPYFDTYLYASRIAEKQGFESLKLSSLARLFGIEQNQAHRAWCDAEANVGVYFKLKELAGK